MPIGPRRQGMEHYVIVWVAYAIIHALPWVFAYILIKRIPEGV
jgi:hypothetical protein